MNNYYYNSSAIAIALQQILDVVIQYLALSNISESRSNALFNRICSCFVVFMLVVHNSVELFILHHLLYQIYLSYKNIFVQIPVISTKFMNTRSCFLPFGMSKSRIKSPQKPRNTTHPHNIHISISMLCLYIQSSKNIQTQTKDLNYSDREMF